MPNFLNHTFLGNTVLLYIEVLFSIVAALVFKRFISKRCASILYNKLVSRTNKNLRKAAFVNLIIPRAGEVTRCTVLLTSEKIPLQASIGSVIAERGLDFVVFALLTLAAFGLEYQTLTAFVSLDCKVFCNAHKISEHKHKSQTIATAPEPGLAGSVAIRGWS